MHERADLTLEHFVTLFRPLFHEWVEHWQARGREAVQIKKEAMTGVGTLLGEAGIPQKSKNGAARSARHTTPSTEGESDADSHPG